MQMTEQINERIIVDMDKALLPRYKFRNFQFKIITDIYLCGPMERAGDGSRLDGAFPSGFLKNVKASFYHYYPEKRTDILHVCSGRIPRCEGMRLDIDPLYKPDFICNAEEMSPIENETFQWTMSDTPYNKDASSKYYGKPMLNKSKVLKEMIRVTKSGGFVSLLDESFPQLNPHLQKQIKNVARIAVTSVPNLTFRAFTVFRKY
jgi:hypothetical protein